MSQPRVTTFEANLPGSGFACISLSGASVAKVQMLGPEVPDALVCSPGFADIQVNGFRGVDFCAAGLTPESISAMLPALWRTGVVRFCPTVITSPLELMERNLRTLECARRADPRFARTAPCYHLEGPYLSPGPSHGAHDPQWMRDPDWDGFQRLQEAADGHVGIVTVAPERPGAVEFIRRAVGSGVLVSVGHTDGTPDDVRRAIDAGARMATHLGNACPQTLDRHRAPFWAQLAEDGLAAGMICDTFHLSGDMVRIIYRMKGPDGCVLVTDAIHATGLSPGPYSLAGTPIELLPSGQVVIAGGSAMAGSALTMDRAIANFIAATGARLEDALKLAVSTPASLLPRLGLSKRVAVGEPADLVLLRGLHVEAVFLAGEAVVCA